MIDAVITWVDGSDPAHESKRLHFQAAGAKRDLDKNALRPTRFRQSGEVWFCVHLMRKHAPWLGTIFLVTDDQRPSWLTPEVAERLGVKVVDHTILFAGLEHYLPVFSSRSIETLLFEIPGISDRFIYFNDDVFLMNPTPKSAYFRSGKCLYRGAWREPVSRPRKLVREIKGSLARRFPSVSIQDGYCGRRAERHMLEDYRERYFSLAHTPFPVSTSFMREVIRDAGLHTNARYRFRNRHQFNPIAYTTHMGFARGLVEEVPDDWGYLSCKAHSSRVIRHRLNRYLCDSSIKSLCVQSMECATPGTRAFIEDCLRRALER